MSETVSCGRRKIEISHPDKPLFSRPRTTKLDLVHHYEQVAAAMLPHVRGRPLALESFPRGTEERGFFLKSVPAHFPRWIDTVEVPKKGGTLTQVVADQAATLVFLAGQNVVTPHVWLSRADRLREPDRLIIDLDPSPGIGFAAVRAAARETGARLRDAGLVPYVMVTGSRGIHVVCPLRRGPTFAAVHGSARALAEALVADDPKRPSRWSGGVLTAVPASTSTSTGSTTPSTLWLRTASGPGPALRWRCRCAGTSSTTGA